MWGKSVLQRAEECAGRIFDEVRCPVVRYGFMPMPLNMDCIVFIFFNLSWHFIYPSKSVVEARWMVLSCKEAFWLTYAARTPWSSPSEF